MGNSSHVGYLTTVPQVLNVTQFIQTVIVGITGVKGQLVRAKWQLNPIEQPDVNTNWIAFQITNNIADANAAVQTDKDGNTNLERSESLEVSCSIYGPNCYEIAGQLRDGFQIQQNLAALRAAKMGFTAVSQLSRSPDLVNERWVDRIEMSIVLTRRIQRDYPILTFSSSKGSIKVVLQDGVNTIDWNAEQ